jgi:hypothetical protein
MSLVVGAPDTAFDRHKFVGLRLDERQDAWDNVCGVLEQVVLQGQDAGWHQVVEVRLEVGDDQVGVGLRILPVHRVQIPDHGTVAHATQELIQVGVGRRHTPAFPNAVSVLNISWYTSAWLSDVSDGWLYECETVECPAATSAASNDGV